MTRSDPPDRRTLPPPPPLDLAGCALFLDLDGTIAPMAPTPAQVVPDAARTSLLTRLGEAMDGAVAVVSGREVADLDRILEGCAPALAAVHGLVRRRADGEVLTAAAPAGVQTARRAFDAFADGRPGVLVEDKGLATTLHFRQAEAEGPAAEALGRRLAGELGLVLQEGRKVVELRAPGPDKGDAIVQFLAEPPFAGRRPVFVGDDLTDEAGFAAALAHGGEAIIVGRRRPTRARFALADVDAVMAWLAASLAETK